MADMECSGTDRGQGEERCEQKLVRSVGVHPGLGAQFKGLGLELKDFVSSHQHALLRG